jgi:hypothetical protein
MTTTSVSTTRFPKILQGPAQTLKQASTLARILELDKACPITSPSPIILQRRQLFIETLSSIGTLGREGASTVGELKDKILTLLNGTMPQGTPLIPYPKKFQAIYAAEFDNPSSLEDLQKCARRIGKDAFALAAPACSCSLRSAEGPALLVSYPRPNTKTPDHPKLPSYVLKWALWNEICSHRVYETLSRLFGSGDQCYNFFTPRAIALNLEKRAYQGMDKQTLELDATNFNHLENAFGKILSLTPESERAEGKDIIIMERIRGANLFDFVKSKYEHLTREHKEKLFTRLGRLAMLDLFMGNNDRLIRNLYNYENACYELEDIESNLGNIVIVWSTVSKEPPAVYAIDNGLDNDLIESPELRSKYLEYLISLQQDPQVLQRLTNTLIGAMKNAVESMLEEELEPGENIHSLREQVAYFSDDLEAMGPAALSLGLKEMYATISKTIVQKWNNQEGEPIRNFLKDNYPAMDQALTERFNTTLTMRK